MVNNKRKRIVNLLAYPIVISILVFIVTSVSAQDSGAKKAMKSFEKARTYYQEGKLDAAKSELGKAIQYDSTKAGPYIMLGDIYTDEGSLEKAADQYKKALARDPERKWVVIELLANTYFSLEKYGDAIVYYSEALGYQNIGQTLRSSMQAKLETSRFRKSLMDHPVSYDPVNLGQAVNTDADEYINAISADGCDIYFTRKSRNQSDYPRHFNEDFYYADIACDTMKQAKLLDYPPGKENDAGALCISADGRLLFFTACFRSDSYGSCDLYYSEKTGDTWSHVRNMGPVVNSESWDAQPSVSSDGNTLYFASKRAGGEGGVDLWKTVRGPDGQWTKPVNLGKIINTSKDEMAPYIHYDNQTLYFSSTGHQGMGGADLFRTVRNDGNWSAPENLGYPINSAADELVIVVGPDGSKGFISGNYPGGFGGYDIYSFVLYDSIRAVPVTYLKGRVFDKNTGAPLEARFELIDVNLDSVIIRASSDKQTGEFLVCLPGQRNYALNVSCKGYLFYSDHFALAEIKSRLDPVLKDIPMEPIAVGNTITLRNIFYETDKYRLKSTSFPELDKLAAFLKANPGLKIEIGGHTDNVGTEEYNLELSTKRAGAVYDYLVSKGIDTGRLSFKGYGESQPVISNDTEEGRAQNRRTEIKVLADR